MSVHVAPDNTQYDSEQRTDACRLDVFSVLQQHSFGHRCSTMSVHPVRCIGVVAIGVDAWFAGREREHNQYTQYNTERDTIQYNAIQYNTMQFNTIQCIPALKAF